MRHIHTPILAASLLVSGATAHGQETPKEIRGSFFPQNYTQEFFVDLDALQDTDVWAAIERTVFAGTMFQSFRKEFGYRLRDLKTIRGGVSVEKVGDQYIERSVFVFRGTKPFKLPTNVGNNRWLLRKPDRISGFPVVQQGEDENDEQSSRPSLFVIPKPLHMVFGDKKLVEPILRGKQRGGVPHPDLLAMTAGPRSLLYFAARVEKGSASGMHDLFGTWLTKDDPITFQMFRLYVDRKTENTIVSMTIRFKDGKTGAPRLRKGLVEFLDKWRKDRRTAFIKELMENVKVRIEGTDLIATVNIGGPKVVGDLMTASSVLPMLLWFGTAPAANVPVVEVVEEEEVEAEAVDEEVQKKAAKKKVEKNKKTGK